jgi:hypothetical protein
MDERRTTWVCNQPAERIGEGLRNQFIKFHESGLLISPGQSAAALIARLDGHATGQIWDVDDEKPRRRALLSGPAGGIRPTDDTASLDI